MFGFEAACREFLSTVFPHQLHPLSSVQWMMHGQAFTTIQVQHRSVSTDEIQPVRHCTGPFAGRLEIVSSVERFCRSGRAIHCAVLLFSVVLLDRDPGPSTIVITLDVCAAGCLWRSGGN